VRAGHEPAIVYSPATKQFSELKGQGVALGVDADRSFQYNELPVAADEQIILIGSDGAWEAENDAGEQFGRERLKHFLAAAAGLPPDRILQTIVDEISRFRGGAPQHDDITLVAVKTR
jgi:sigma-B regulation protein RsbU (phosphoserine phosphatase)